MRIDNVLDFKKEKLLDSYNFYLIGFRCSIRTPKSRNTPSNPMRQESKREEDRKSKSRVVLPAAFHTGVVAETDAYQPILTNEFKEMD